MDPFYCNICKKQNASQTMSDCDAFPICPKCKIELKYKDSPIRKITLDRKREMARKHYEKNR